MDNDCRIRQLNKTYVMDRSKWKLLKTSYNTHRDRDNERVQCVFSFHKSAANDISAHHSPVSTYNKHELECGPMPNVMVALPNIGGALCSTPQSLADAHY